MHDSSRTFFSFSFAIYASEFHIFQYQFQFLAIIVDNKYFLFSFCKMDGKTIVKLRKTNETMLERSTIWFDKQKKIGI